jgi:trk system potassium uptake protein TrkH
MLFKLVHTENADAPMLSIPFSISTFFKLSQFEKTVLLIVLIEPEFDLLEASFEVVSALATVGLSIGGSSNLTSIGKLLIVIYMFMGRVGLLTIFLALVAKNTVNKQQIRYPEGRIIVG